MKKFPLPHGLYDAFSSLKEGEDLQPFYEAVHDLAKQLPHFIEPVGFESTLLWLGEDQYGATTLEAFGQAQSPPGILFWYDTRNKIWLLRLRRPESGDEHLIMLDTYFGAKKISFTGHQERADGNADAFMPRVKDPCGAELIAVRDLWMRVLETHYGVEVKSSSSEAES